jgi:hypothetical protein
MGIYLTLNLEKASFEDNKKFTKLLYNADISSKRIYFDILDCNKSLQRQKEENMTLDKYLRNISRDAFIAFFVDREQLNINTGILEKTMTLAWRGDFKNKFGIEHFAWFECPTRECYHTADKIFQSAYKTPIQNYPYRL